MTYMYMLCIYNAGRYWSCHCYCFCALCFVWPHVSCVHNNNNKIMQAMFAWQIPAGSCAMYEERKSNYCKILVPVRKLWRTLILTSHNTMCYSGIVQIYPAKLKLCQCATASPIWMLSSWPTARLFVAYLLLSDSLSTAYWPYPWGAVSHHGPCVEKTQQLLQELDTSRC